MQSELDGNRETPVSPNFLAASPVSSLSRRQQQHHQAPVQTSPEIRSLASNQMRTSNVSNSGAAVAVMMTPSFYSTIVPLVSSPQQEQLQQQQPQLSTPGQIPFSSWRRRHPMPTNGTATTDLLLLLSYGMEEQRGNSDAMGGGRSDVVLDHVALRSLRTVPDGVSGEARDGLSRRWFETLYTYAPVEAEFCVFFYANRTVSIVWMVVLAGTVACSMVMYQRAVVVTTARNVAASSAAVWLLCAFTAHVLQRRRTEIVAALQAREDEDTTGQSNAYVYLARELNSAVAGEALPAEEALSRRSTVGGETVVRRRALHCNTFTQELVLIVCHLLVVVYGIGSVMAPSSSSCENFLTSSTAQFPPMCQRGVRIFAQAIYLAVAIPLIVALSVRTVIMVPLYILGTALFCGLYWVPGVPYWGDNATMPPAILLIACEMIVCLTTAVIRERRRRTGFERHVERQRRSTEAASIQKHIERVTAAHLPLNLLLRSEIKEHEVSAAAAKSPHVNNSSSKHFNFSNTGGSSVGGGAGQLDALFLATNAGASGGGGGGSPSGAALLLSTAGGAMRGAPDGAAAKPSEVAPNSVLKRETHRGVAVCIGLCQFRAWAYAHGPSAIVDVVTVLHEVVDSCVFCALTSSEQRRTSENAGTLKKKGQEGESARSSSAATTGHNGGFSVQAMKCHTLDGGDSILIVAMTSGLCGTVSGTRDGDGRQRRESTTSSRDCPVFSECDVEERRRLLGFVADFACLVAERIPSAVTDCVERLSLTTEGRVRDVASLLPLIAVCEGACGCLFESHTHNMVGYGPAVHGAEELCRARHAVCGSSVSTAGGMARGATTTTTTLLWRGLQPSSVSSIVSLLCSSSTAGGCHWTASELGLPDALGFIEAIEDSSNRSNALKVKADLEAYCVTMGAMPSEGEIRSYLLEAQPPHQPRQLLVMGSCGGGAPMCGDDFGCGHGSEAQGVSRSPSRATSGLAPAAALCAHEGKRYSTTSTHSGHEPSQQFLLPFASLGDPAAAHVSPQPAATPLANSGMSANSDDPAVHNVSPLPAALLSQPIRNEYHPGGNMGGSNELGQVVHVVPEVDPTRISELQPNTVRTRAETSQRHYGEDGDDGDDDDGGVTNEQCRRAAEGGGASDVAAGPLGDYFESLYCCGIPYRFANTQTEADYQLMSDNPELADYELRMSSFSSAVSLAALLVANSIFSGTPGVIPRGRGGVGGDHHHHDAPLPYQMPVTWCAFGLLLVLASLCAYSYLPSSLSRTAHHLIFIPAVQLCYLCAVFLAPRNTVLGETQGMFVIVCLNWCAHRPMFLPLTALITWDFFVGVAFILREQFYLRSGLPLQTIAPAAYIMGACVTLCVRDYTRRQAFQVERQIELIRGEIEDYCKRLESALDRLVPKGIAEPLVRRVRMSQQRSVILRQGALLSRGLLLPPNGTRNPLVASRSDGRRWSRDPRGQQLRIPGSNVSDMRIQNLAHQGLSTAFPRTHPRRSGSMNMALADTPFVCLRISEDQIWSQQQKRWSRDSSKRRSSGLAAGTAGQQLQKRGSGCSAAAAVSPDPVPIVATPHANSSAAASAGGAASGGLVLEIPGLTITSGDPVQRVAQNPLRPAPVDVHGVGGPFGACADAAPVPGGRGSTMATPCAATNSAYPLLSDCISALRDFADQVQVVECTRDSILIVGKQSDTQATTEERATLILNVAKCLHQKLSSTSRNHLSSLTPSSRRTSAFSPANMLSQPQSLAASALTPLAASNHNAALSWSGYVTTQAARVHMVVDMGPAMGAMVGSREILFGFHGSTLQQALAALNELSTLGGGGGCSFSSTGTTAGGMMACSLDVLDRSATGLELQSWFPGASAYLTSIRPLAPHLAPEVKADSLPQPAVVACVDSHASVPPTMLSRPPGLPPRHYVVQGM